MAFLGLMTLACVSLLFYASYQCGMKRGKHSVPAGSIDGPEEFGRYYRAQANLLESLMMFLPTVWLLGHFGNMTLASVIALVYFAGRVMYHLAYTSDDPSTRFKPFVVGVVCTALALVGALVSIGIRALT